MELIAYIDLMKNIVRNYKVYAEKKKKECPRFNPIREIDVCFQKKICQNYAVSSVSLF